MGTPTVPYKVMAKGYQITGDVKNGYKATVPYLVLWSDAFTFADQIFGSATASKVGPVSWTLPHRFPVASANLYAQSFSMEPSGASGSAIPNKGLGPGEFFTHAVVKVQYETPNEVQQQTQDDPKNLQQLDQNNPITMCEQSVKMSGKMETHKAGSFLFAGTGAPVTGQTGVVIAECKLVLTFPRVPYLPWKLVRPYIGSVNKLAILDVPKGELLLEGMDTKTVKSKDGLSQQVQLEFAWSSIGEWNQLPLNGTPTLVYRNGTSNTDANRIYPYKDHGDIFRQINYGS